VITWLQTPFLVYIGHLRSGELHLSALPLFSRKFFATIELAELVPSVTFIFIWILEPSILKLKLVVTPSLILIVLLNNEAPLLAKTLSTLIV